MAGNNRKNELRALFSAGAPAADPQTPAETASGELTPVNARPAAPLDAPRAASGAVKAMGLSLGSITREAEEARVLREALTQGERVVSLDPALVESSFVEDRLTDGEIDDADFLALVESIRENGQQSPILVRPHPEKQGHYQTAYGHRRLKAVRRLELQVKAIVRTLTDAELVLAQGKENAERRNLSFIERALFAAALVARGFDRKVIGDALAVQKSELSRLLQVADGVPHEVARAIGPAPKAGRERWMAIGTLLERQEARARAQDEIASPRFRAVDSDQRFQLVFNRLSQSDKPEQERPEELKDAAGRVFARLKRDGKAPRIEFLPGTHPAVVQEAVSMLAKWHAAFVENQKP
ncbi:plasmid partitioning protein RepB [Sinorhizobium meliloti]|uniref:plasmid partitioning protein RepB n=1 Tax=Rhizobium meliloti TaxID=382 RepID=UPI0002A55616|nr:plasmid partitioning protein RepB [Sinorhizobium meliloti]AGA10240.1 plasmid partitioning protein RepB [Sinorhizobium meliloti GR4]RVL07829.1 plasmid partitioning protein RepB [Sinorhizobium meliloti]RVM98899.1 plasmid partitioning protein RepB [Sinorhizobium meliloti]RVN03727.1 plasmid partitioning protein RepB [Sinorhizobium meliloti]